MNTYFSLVPVLTVLLYSYKLYPVPTSTCRYTVAKVQYIKPVLYWHPGTNSGSAIYLKRIANQIAN